MNEKIRPSDLRAHAKVLVELSLMPPLEKVLAAVAETRKKYKPQIEDIRQEQSKRTLYECGICDCYHPWEFDGDCRDDSNRFGSPEEYAAKRNVPDVEVRSMDDRVKADEEGE